jgi:MscS family membrane protein
VFITSLRVGIRVLSLGLLVSLVAWAQVTVPGTASTAAQTAETPKDSLGRTTPRGTVMGFLVAAQKGDTEIAVEYLNTRLRGKAEATLANQLAAVLDSRLPARLNQLSDQPQGSLSLLKANQELVGTISSAKGNVDIVLERVDRGESGLIWLFSSKTLEAIPVVYEEIDIVNVDAILPEFLVRNRIFGVQLFEWVVVFVGIPLFYLSTVLLDWLLRPIVGRLRRRWSKKSDLLNVEVLPKPLRLLLLAITIRWILAEVSLSLLARQFWSSFAAIIAIAAAVWLLIILSRLGEEYAVRSLRRRDLTGASSILRLTRRVADLLVIFAGVLLILHYFGINPTAALAGLGVGGIAVALAAQKTLENMIGGISLIFDKAVQAGDTLKVGDTLGTVEEIGLRSTRIRTFDRTVVTVPNGQIANVSIEKLSVRDRFWFHPLIGLRYGTSVAQISSVVSHVHELLTHNSCVEQSSLRVRFLGFGSSSLDVEVSAYVYARDWNCFLEIQEVLLLRIMEIVQEAGTQIALPSQITYLTPDSVVRGRQLRSLRNAAEKKDTGEPAVAKSA